jgi:rRNA pseudouridine-1189 N-methylase Emg1 (Nep1/Mra1 family)
MRTPKTVETFIASLNELLANGQITISEETVTLKSLNYILGALAPGYSILTMHDVQGQLAGFAPKFTPPTTPVDAAVSYPE